MVRPVTNGSAWGCPGQVGSEPFAGARLPTVPSLAFGWVWITRGGRVRDLLEELRRHRLPGTGASGDLLGRLRDIPGRDEGGDGMAIGQRQPEAVPARSTRGP